MFQVSLWAMLKIITRWLFVIILIELVIGGGRLINFGMVSLRMVLFSLALLISIVHVLRGEQIEKKYRWLLLIFTIMLAIGITIGLITEANKILILEDVKPLLFFYLLPFFSIAVTTENDLLKTRSVLMLASVFMAFIFLVILLLIFTNILPFSDFYNLTYLTDEFFFRGEYSFFYKGFVYLCIGFLFTHLTYNKSKHRILNILFIAIVLTFTRGLIFALALCYTVYYLFIKRFYVRTIVACVVCVFILFFGKSLYGTISKQLSTASGNEKNFSGQEDEALLGDRELSDNVRKLQIRQVAMATTVSSFVWGHGFGNGIDIRPVHMEISYLEIFHKQGMIGIACWSVIFFSLIVSYKSLLPNSNFGDAFLLAALFIFFQSLTNQYVNNPIGLGMILLSQVSLDVLSKEINKVN